MSTIWGIIHKTIQQAEEETLGKRTVKKKKGEYKTPCYDEPVKILSIEKKNFLHYKRNKTEETTEQYVRMRNPFNRDINHNKEEHW